MKIGDIINEGTILVCREEQATGCGIVYLKAGSIVKCARETAQWSNSVKVFRNKKAENEEHWHPIELAKVRRAKTHEIEMWNKEIYFVKSVNTIDK
jgi:hypothetical protein